MSLSSLNAVFKLTHYDILKGRNEVCKNIPPRSAVIFWGEGRGNGTKK
jgi:hypothetical protein